MRKVLLACVLFFGGAGLLSAAATSSGSVTWAGRTISYKIEGATGASSSVAANDGQCVLTFQIDGTEHLITFVKDRVECGKERATIKPTARIEINADKDGVRIKADGEQVLPKKKS